MAYRGNDYSFVIDSSFQPFSMQEMLIPMTAYKDAYEQAEAAYADLSDKSDKFKYLSETLPEGSKARQIYEGYANNLAAQAEDLATHGLNMSNRRALTSLKRRYQGEIGRLAAADEAMQKEKELRRNMMSKDPTMLYADDNLTIDRFLDEERPSLYGISGTELYSRGVAAGKAASSRIFKAGDAGKTLGGYYRDFVQEMGYDPNKLNQWEAEMLSNEFANKVSVLPELQEAANQIMESTGAKENLTGNNLRKGWQNTIRGIIDGSVHTVDHKPYRDEGEMSAAQRAANERENKQETRAQNQFELSLAASGMVRDGNGYRYDFRQDPKNAGTAWMYEFGEDGSIKGYSEAYKQAVKENMLPSNQAPRNTNSRSTGSSNRSISPSFKLPNEISWNIDGSANYKGKKVGKQITYEEAIAAVPDFAKFVTNEYANNFAYFYNDDTKIVTPIPIGQGASQQETVPSTDDDNQL